MPSERQESKTIAVVKVDEVGKYWDIVGESPKRSTNTTQREEDERYTQLQGKWAYYYEVGTTITITLVCEVVTPEPNNEPDEEIRTGGLML